ncbi:hypothetical protein M409DRAFT_70365 [Zasmidium cellare ATCC 36951]|uniref:Zn(2)-C6 fungal-type domain-containing protein n=1 Tax=Zasmidium cellare ATCC 36951 TaxID=1080233 RepID=A0A6A6C365_ZASCE|nr:uncharacterized protein M409DRAFT_70365 [Zasmidium cellare ATCC 36951]KAF2160630.1 hypothetical protein M409DRAFT_70365 [Zasmidium cellare ATCC 36951]
MPRPKVKPQDRQRSARACLPCKASKIRCDAATPCGPCLKRERTSACVYLESSRKRQKTSQNSPLPTPSLDDTSPQFEGSPAETSDIVRVQPIGTSLPASNAPAVTATTTPTPEPGHSASRTTESRMLLSSKGEKLYIGENASLSFLQFLRQILKKYMGPSAFTENQFRENMLEVELARDESPLVCDQSRGEKYNLVQLYREASSGILDLFTVDEVHGFLDRHNALSPSAFIDDEDKRAKAEQAFLNMMLAIGSQCRGQNPLDSYNAARSFTCAQKFAFEGFLCDPSLDMVRVFLMMAFYMLGACHRNAAFMCLGIASKAASALGLHRKEPNKALSTIEFTTRWRTWKSLLILDTIVSSILGRPGGLPPMRLDEDNSADADIVIGDYDRPRWMASRAVFTICSHIIELEQQIGNGTNINSATAESFLQRLRKWNETIPVELRHFASMKDTTLSPADRELFIGATHVACTYYFTIVLVTRPFLISHLVSQIRRRRPHDRRPSADRLAPSHVSDLAQACLDSAMYMAKTGYMAISSQILSNNMCLLKAWMFAAGLLLGFSMFAQVEPVPEVDGAFQNAISVLEQLGQLSPQARHYFEILSTFSDAIYARREQLGRERRKKSDRYVSQIFTADFQDPSVAGTSSAPAATGDAAAYTTPSSAGVNGATGVDPNIDPMLNFDLDGYDLSLNYPQAPNDEWTDMPLLSDNLYIDWESLWPVLEN